MIIEQIYTGCLSQGAYYIESQGEVAIIDPLREVKPYLNRVAKTKAKVKYIFETHSLILSVDTLPFQKKQETHCLWPNANPDFEVIIAKDEQVFPLGEVSIVALHTPWTHDDTLIT